MNIGPLLSGSLDAARLALAQPLHAHDSGNPSMPGLSSAFDNAQPAIGQPPAPTEVAPLPQAQPVRLASLHLDASRFDAGLQERLRRSRSDEPEDEPREDAKDAPSHDRDHAAEPERGYRAKAAPRAASQDWRVSLARRWEASSSPAAQQALRLARQQWAMGRRVLLACAAGTVADDADTTLGWGALLLGHSIAPPGRVHPTHETLGPNAASTLRLDGARWPLRLQWRRAPPPWQWFHARAIKAAEPGRAWQLHPDPEAGEQRASVALQLGPLFNAEQRWQQLGLRLEAAQAFRDALSTQWSVWLLASLGRWMDDEPPEVEPPEAEWQAGQTPW